MNCDVLICDHAHYLKVIRSYLFFLRKWFLFHWRMGCRSSPHRPILSPSLVVVVFKEMNIYFVCTSVMFLHSTGTVWTGVCRTFALQTDRIHSVVEHVSYAWKRVTSPVLRGPWKTQSSSPFSVANGYCPTVGTSYGKCTATEMCTRC